MNKEEHRAVKQYALMIVAKHGDVGAVALLEKYNQDNQRDATIRVVAKMYLQRLEGQDWTKHPTAYSETARITLND